VNQVLRRQPAARVRVFAVWEPMLAIDWTPPNSRALARLGDARVRQFWDSEHVLASRMVRDARDPQPKPNCCEMDGNLWDLAAVYPPGAVWSDRMPAARVFDGPIVKVQDRIAKGVAAPASGR
jgi:hypothetical protein